MQSLPPDRTRPLVFLHIRKTAGCSVRNWLRNRFAVKDCLLDCHHAARQSIDPSTYRFITGHVGFDYLGRFRQRPICLVVLRHPVERALSAYSFFQRNDDQYLRWLQDTIPPVQAEERVRFTRRANELSLVEFLEREPDLARSLLGDVQSRCLLGRSDRAPQSDQELLAEAARNLESCAIVGVTEYLDASLARVANYMGWDDDFHTVPHDNATHGRPGLQEIDPRALAILTEWNRVDLQLYRVAKQLFESWRPLPRAGLAELPGCSDFTFDQPIHGSGWHPREKGVRGWFCWMGREAWLDLEPEGTGDRVLEARVAHVLRPAILDGLQVRVNGRRLASRIHGNGAMRVVEAIVPASIVKADRDRVRVTFTLRETARPCDLVPNNPDARQLGLAFERIRFVPRPSRRGNPIALLAKWFGRLSLRSPDNT